MSEAALKRALAQFVRVNATRFTEELSRNGVSREISSVSTTILSPPKGFYHIWIDVSGDDEFSKVGLTQLASPPRAARHQASIIAYEMAQVRESEETPYKTDHEQFDLFVGRIKALLADSTTSFLDNRTGIGFTLDRATGNSDRLIRRVNQTGNFNQNQQFIPELTSMLSFPVYQGCVDNDKLW